MRKINSFSIHIIFTLLGAGVLLLVMSSSSLSQEIKKCLICHGKPDLKKVLKSGRVISLYVDEDELRGSVHAERRCGECHVDIIEIPHKGRIKTVDCTQCHYRGNPVGAPQKDIYRDYRESVHGMAVSSGNPDAPICQDCHGDHDIKGIDDPYSRVYKLNISGTCARCHLEIYAKFKMSIHGVALDQGIMDAPACTDCHGEHAIKGPESPESSVFATKIGETCPKCHAAEGIMSKYGIETSQVTTYQESYHGVASKFGQRLVANCASCHGVHDIRPPEDPLSSVYIKNIPKTCGNCHPGANINFAKGKIHVEPGSRESGLIYYVSQFFKWLTILVMIGLLIHIALDLYRKYRRRAA